MCLHTYTHRLMWQHRSQYGISDSLCSPGHRLLPPPRWGTWPSATPLSCTHLWQSERQQQIVGKKIVILHHTRGQWRQSRWGRAALISAAVLWGWDSHNSALGKVITCSNSHAPELNPLTTMAGKHTGLPAWSSSLPSSSPSSRTHRHSLAPGSYTFYSYAIKIWKHTHTHTHRERGLVGTWLSLLRLMLLKL